MQKTTKPFTKPLLPFYLSLCCWMSILTTGAISVNDRVQANGTVNVRQTAAGTLVGTQSLGSKGTVTAGPVVATLSGTSYTWFNVNFDAGVDGWVADIGLTLIPSATPPDLITQSLAVNPTSAQAGATVNITFIVRNNGGSTAAASTTNIRLATSNGNVTSNDPLLTSIAVPSITAGNSYPVNVNVTIPAGRAAGQNYIWVILDTGSTAGQGAGNEGNDRTYVPFTVTQPATPPDLVTQSLVVNPTSGQAASAVNVSFTILNNGGSTAAASTTNIRLATSNANVTSNDPLLTSVAVPALAAGNTFPVNVNITIPAGRSAGQNYIWVILDAGSSAGQGSSNEGNDRTLVPFTVTQPVTPPDLITQNLAVNPTSAQAGAGVNVTFTIQNNGGSTAAASTTNIRLATSNANVTSNDPLLTSISVPSLTPGATFPVNVNVTIPGGRAQGQNYIWVILDAGSSAGQGSANEANDRTNVPFTVSPTLSPPDLVTQNFVVNPGSAFAGTSVNVIFTIRNNGGSPAAASTTNIRLATSNADVTSNDPLLTSVSVPSLIAGGTFPVNVNVTIPAGRAAGQNYIWVILDTGSSAGQGAANEMNDRTSVPFSVSSIVVDTPPDLVAENLVINPTSGQGGSTVNVSFTIRHKSGTLPAAPSTTNIRLATSNLNVTINDPLLTSVSVPSLTAGGTFPVNVNVTIPAGRAAGQNYIWVILDAGSTAGQTSPNEANDRTSVPFTVGPSQKGTFRLPSL